VKIDAEEIDLGVHRAIPCGLILNELFSNALKYAFPDGRSGAIRVHFARLESGDVALSVEDNGVGLPDEFDWENSESVGLRVVRILARQIDAEVSLERGGVGTHFSMRFPAHSPTAVTPAPAAEPDKVESWSEQGGSGPSRSLLRSASASL
jgi:two-component system, sensor histidine kinase PdtaS